MKAPEGWVIVGNVMHEEKRLREAGYVSIQGHLRTIAERDVALSRVQELETLRRGHDDGQRVIVARDVYERLLFERDELKAKLDKAAAKPSPTDPVPPLATDSAIFRPAESKPTLRDILPTSVEDEAIVDELLRKRSESLPVRPMVRHEDLVRLKERLAAVEELLLYRCTYSSSPPEHMVAKVRRAGGS